MKFPQSNWNLFFNVLSCHTRPKPVGCQHPPPTPHPLPQAYVIATSTKVDVSKVECAKFVDGYFGKAEKAAKKKKGDQFFEEAPLKNEPTATRLADQKTVDAALMPAIEKGGPVMAKYLKARFSLSRAQKPHLMLF